MEKKVSSTPNRTGAPNDFTVDVSPICPAQSTVKKNPRKKLTLQSSNSPSSSGKLDDVDHLYLYSSYVLATFTEISSQAYKKETMNKHMKKVLQMHRLLNDQMKILNHLTLNQQKVEGNRIMKEVGAVVEELNDQMKLLNHLKLKQQKVEGNRLMKEVGAVVEEDLIPVVHLSEEFLRCGASFSNLVSQNLSVVENHALANPSAKSDRVLLEADLKKCAATNNQVVDILKQVNKILPRLDHLCSAIKAFSSVEKDLSSLNSTLDDLEDQNLEFFVNYLFETEDERDNACKIGLEDALDNPL